MISITVDSKRQSNAVEEVDFVFKPWFKACEEKCVYFSVIFNLFWRSAIFLLVPKKHVVIREF